MIAPATDTGRHLDGFEVPIHHSLGAPLLLGGAPRGLAIINGTLPRSEIIVHLRCAIISDRGSLTVTAAGVA